MISAVEPFELGVERPFRTMTLRLPSASMNRHLRRPGSANGALIPRNSRVGTLLGSLIRMLWRGDFGVTRPDGTSALEHVLALAACAVEAGDRRRPWPTAAAHAAIYAHALRAIERQCSEPGLAPAGLAKSLGVSLRTLQAIFAENDDAIERRIQRVRLARATELLEDPSRRCRPIGELALPAGFNELSHFTRAFVRAHGRTPGAWRRERMETSSPR